MLHSDTLSCFCEPLPGFYLQALCLAFVGLIPCTEHKATHKSELRDPQSDPRIQLSALGLLEPFACSYREQEVPGSFISLRWFLAQDCLMQDIRASLLSLSWENLSEAPFVLQSFLQDRADI